MNITIPLVFLCMLLNTAAQLLLKETMNKIGGVSFTLHNFIPIGLKVAFNPYFIAGVTAYVLSMCVWLLVLSRLDVTIAYPLTSIAFIFVAFAGAYFFNEPLTMTRIAGIVVIIGGIYLLTRA